MFGFGSLLLVPLANKIILSQGIDDSFMILGFVIMSFVCLGAFLIKNPPNFKACVCNVSDVEIGPRQMLGRIKFWLFWAIFTFSASFRGFFS